MAKMSFGFPSDVLRLLCLNSAVDGGFSKQHIGCQQTEAAAASLGSVGVLSRYQRTFSLPVDGSPALEWTQEPEWVSEWVGSVTELNSL